MIALDTNVLVYAHRRDLPLHETAAAVVARALTGNEPVALCWPVVHEFLAVVTSNRVFVKPTPPSRAFDQVHDWFASPVARSLGESSRHLETVAGLALASRSHGPVIHDARIAAICIDHGVRELWTADRDFSRFPQVPIRNPLV